MNALIGEEAIVGIKKIDERLLTEERLIFIRTKFIEKVSTEAQKQKEWLYTPTSSCAEFNRGYYACFEQFMEILCDLKILSRW